MPTETVTMASITPTPETAASPRFGPTWSGEELLLLRQAAAQGPRALDRLPETLVARGFPARSPAAIQHKLTRLTQPQSSYTPRPPLSEAEHRIIFERARLGAPPSHIHAALARAGFNRSRWSVYRTLVRLRKHGLLLPVNPFPSPAKSWGGAGRWVEPPDKAEREHIVATRLRWLAQELPPTGIALTLPGRQWRRTLTSLDGLVDEIIALEREPDAYQALLEALRQEPPSATPVSLLHADFWAVATDPPGPVRILDYDGMDAMRPDLLEALRLALGHLTPRAIVRLTFETSHGTSFDGVLSVVEERRPIEAVWALPHCQGRPMITALARVGPPHTEEERKKP